MTTGSRSKHLDVKRALKEGHAHALSMYCPGERTPVLWGKMHSSCVVFYLRTSGGPWDTELPSPGAGATWPWPSRGGAKGYGSIPGLEGRKRVGLYVPDVPLLLVPWNAVGGQGRHGRTLLPQLMHKPVFGLRAITGGARGPFSVAFLSLQCLWLGNPGQQKDNMLQFKSYITAALLNLGSVRE